jgi:inner membrane protein involved in colicin E2 resistance
VTGQQVAGLAGIALVMLVLGACALAAHATFDVVVIAAAGGWCAARSMYGTRD